MYNIFFSKRYYNLGKMFALIFVSSLILGTALGALLSELEKLFYSNSNRLSLTISFVLLTIALSFLKLSLGPVTISFSSLLVCMMLGTVFCNLSEFSSDIMHRAEQHITVLVIYFSFRDDSASK